MFIIVTETKQAEPQWKGIPGDTPMYVSWEIPTFNQWNLNMHLDHEVTRAWKTEEKNTIDQTKTAFTQLYLRFIYASFMVEYYMCNPGNQ